MSGASTLPQVVSTDIAMDNGWESHILMPTQKIWGDVECFGCGRRKLVLGDACLHDGPEQLVLCFVAEHRECDDIGFTTVKHNLDRGTGIIGGADGVA